MFSKWIYSLLKFFDICGFFTEIQQSQNSSKRFGSIKVFILHIFWALGALIIVITFSIKTRVLGDVLPYKVNTTLQNTCGVLIYCVIIIESFFQRKIQQKFWNIYKYIHTDQQQQQHNKFSHRTLHLKVYLIKLLSYFSASIPVDVYLMCYFFNFVESHFFYSLAYMFFVVIYQTRIFYYVFYLELIKYELKAIKNPLKSVALVNDLKGNLIRLDAPSQMKTIYKHYSQICELNDCINQIFGLSNFVTILYCFELALTDANWAYTSFDQWPMGYTYGNLSYFDWVCSYKCLFNVVSSFCFD